MKFLKILGKVMKYIIITVVVLVLLLVLLLVFFRYYNYIYLTIKGANLENKVQWKLVNFMKIKGETHATVLSKKAAAIQKYDTRTFYPYDGVLGCVGGSDAGEISGIYFDRVRKTGESQTFWMDYHQTAYLFCTNDDGETFTKQALGNGYVSKVRKFKDNYIATVEDVFDDARTYISKDAGKSWELFLPYAIQHFFNLDSFIYVESIKKIYPYPMKVDDKEITLYSYNGYNYYYTKDGGKTKTPVPDKILEYARTTQEEETNYPLQFDTYDDKLIFLLKDSLVLVDIDTLKEERIKLDFPKGYKIASHESREYGRNLFEGIDIGKHGYNINPMQINEGNNKPYILLQKENTSDTIAAQTSLWYPFSNVHVKLHKDLSPMIPFNKVNGNHIGGFIKIFGVYVHYWTFDEGKNWNFLPMPEFRFPKGQIFQNGRVWLIGSIWRKDMNEGGDVYLFMGNYEGTAKNEQILDREIIQKNNIALKSTNYKAVLPKGHPQEKKLEDSPFSYSFYEKGTPFSYENLGEFDINSIKWIEKEE